MAHSASSGLKRETLAPQNPSQLTPCSAGEGVTLVEWLQYNGLAMVV